MDILKAVYEYLNLGRWELGKLKTFDFFTTLNNEKTYFKDLLIF